MMSHEQTHEASEEVVEDTEDLEEAETSTESDEVEIIDSQEDSNELEELTAERDELKDRLLRLQAEFDNYKKRTQKEKLAEREYKSMDLASEIIPVLDNFERALQVESTEENKGLIEGITMVYEQLLKALEKEDIKPMTVLNEVFDPNLHHAVMQTEEEDVEENIITEELQKGYLIKDKVIRPAMVKVNK